MPRSRPSPRHVPKPHCTMCLSLTADFTLVPHTLLPSVRRCRRDPEKRCRGKCKWGPADSMWWSSWPRSTSTRLCGPTTTSRRCSSGTTRPRFPSAAAHTPQTLPPSIFEPETEALQAVCRCTAAGRVPLEGCIPAAPGSIRPPGPRWQRLAAPSLPLPPPHSGSTGPRVP